MTNYIHLENNKILGSGECPMGEPFQSIEISEELYNDFNADPDKYIWNGSEIVENPNYEEIKRQKERARLDMLSMTPLDFLKALNKIGIRYETVKQIMEANPEVEMEMKFCQNVYRGHPMINQFATQFGVTSEQLDYMFKKANGEVD